MQQRPLGSSGLQVSVVGLGCNNFGNRTDKEASRKVIDRAIEAGITLFDTADIYGNRGGSETIIGDVLGKRRDDIVLATKFAGPMDDAGRLKGASRRYVMTAVEASLRRLRTDWIDLYQVHFPDPETPIEETLEALGDLVRAGKVRYIGLSNHPAWKVADAWWTARDRRLIPFVSCQDEYSLLVRGIESELLPALEHFGIGLLPYFPLAGGLLTGKYQPDAPPPEGSRMAKNPSFGERYRTPANNAKVERLRAFCAQRGHTLLELAFSWLLAHRPVASVIAGATKPEQIDANIAAAGWSLTGEDLAEIDRLVA
jgi:aryl-alcohol dehydrogenase-like predicted oxidoreductase